MQAEKLRLDATRSRNWVKAQEEGDETVEQLNASVQRIKAVQRAALVLLKTHAPTAARAFTGEGPDKDGDIEVIASEDVHDVNDDDDDGDDGEEEGGEEDDEEDDEEDGE
jgi:hypothetical protein